ncbi:MAG TPA: FAD-dependent oxidoreductase [Desulfobacterales bacterium]|nr:FAD-dependent oxidoreductase [Desulfobacterales bacterium]
MAYPKVLVIGGGIAGMTAALELARFGAEVDIVERNRRLGGHAAEFACKALEACVKCGACLVSETLEAAATHPRISAYTDSRVEAITGGDRFAYTLRNTPGTAIRGEADAVVIAAGFGTFDPSTKPYGYGRFPNIITNLDLERMLRSNAKAVRPSDGGAPKRMAFIQCVGSRDAKLGHLWCSQFCCGAALRAARLIRRRQPQTDITIFFIDIQTFGRDFESFYRESQREIRFIRAIPGDAFQVEDSGIRLSYVDDSSRQSREEIFDLVVLSTGMVPPEGLAQTAGGLGLALTPSGYMGAQAHRGVFAAGAVRGPMRIEETIADARHTACQVLAFLGIKGGSPEPLVVERRTIVSRLVAPGRG